MKYSTNVTNYFNHVKVNKKLKKKLLAYSLRVMIYLILIFGMIISFALGCKCLAINTDAMATGASYGLFGWLGVMLFLISISIGLTIFLFTDKLLRMDKKKGLFDRILEFMSID